MSIGLKKSRCWVVEVVVGIEDGGFLIVNGCEGM